MRTASELKELKEEGILGKQILIFVQQFRSLLVASPEILAETIMLLHSLVLLSDKVLPVKSFFLVTQEMQRNHRLAWTLAQALTKDLPTKIKDERAAVLEVELRAKGAAFLAATLSEELKKNDGVDAHTAPDLIIKINQEAQRHLATEDIFMVACSFLQVEIAKHGSIYYLRGESPDIRETKRNRNPLNLADEIVLKKLSSNLTRPDEERGTVERGQIDSGFNHLVRLNKLYLTMGEAVRWIEDGKRKNIPRHRIDIRKRFELTHTDYEWILSAARREGLGSSFSQRKKDPSNSYTLRANNHQRVIAYAEKIGHSPQKTLNKILDDFFSIMEKHRERSNIES